MQTKPAAPKLKSENNSKLKRERSSTSTSSKPAKIAKTADGREYIDLASDSEDGNVKGERIVLSKDVKKSNAKIEVLDLLD